MVRVSDMLLVSDLDGTVVPAFGGISQRVLDAVARFREKGGIFTIATGRSPASAREVAAMLGVNTAFIANNGALIYDVQKGKAAWFQPLPGHFREIIREIRCKFPEVGIAAISSQDTYYMVVKNPYLYVRDTVKYFDFTGENEPEAELPENCCKVLFTLPPERFAAISGEIRARSYPGVEFVASGGECFEMMAEHISKGYPLEKLARFHGKTLQTTIAVGDYYNDREMIAQAGIGVAMRNAPPEIQAVAKLVVSSCEEDGVAELIDHLIDTGS